MTTTSRGSTVVVDANLAVWAVLPLIAAVDVIGLLAEWRRQGLRLVAPALWLPECVSAIRRTVHAGAVSAEDGQTALEDLLSLGIEILPISAQQARSAFKWAERLGQAQAYDGFYLALTEELGAEFWTADRRLANGARRAGAVWVRSV